MLNLCRGEPVAGRIKPSFFVDTSTTPALGSPVEANLPTARVRFAGSD
jgi:hypothetical protein